MKEVEERIEEKRKSQLHGGMLYLERIDGILKSLDMAAVLFDGERPELCGLPKRKHQQRLSLLKVLFRELSPKMADTEKESHFAKQLEIQKEWDTLEEALLMGRRKVSGRFSRLFDIWEIELRDVIEKKGLLMPDKATSLDAASQ